MPIKIKYSIECINQNLLYEIRLRNGFPIILNYDFDRYYLGGLGVTKDKSRSIICCSEDIKEIIRKVTEQSIYAFNERIKQGFLTTPQGIRIGLSGECVFENDKIITIKNFSSLLIRIPHEIIGCSNLIIDKIMDKDTIRNTLILSPPFYGKTTLLKDIARQLNDNVDKSILIIDERGEFSSVEGENIDKISYSNKIFAFNCAIRTLSPSIIITDELSSKSDFDYTLFAVNSGVKIIASCHAKDVSDLINRPYFDKSVFDRYVVLDSKGVPGKIKGVYDKDFIKV